MLERLLLNEREVLQEFSFYCYEKLFFPSWYSFFLLQVPTSRRLFRCDFTLVHVNMWTTWVQSQMDWSRTVSVTWFPNGPMDGSKCLWVLKLSRWQNHHDTLLLCFSLICAAFFFGLMVWQHFCQKQEVPKWTAEPVEWAHRSVSDRPRLPVHQSGCLAGF